ncbi:H-NS histone family protein [Tardiphaga sp. P9-11]|jgi:DNA-binding protein H-NS|uniref:H-NS histone family protein n=1 Tax=Tardiphaga sp. P9-11 TaxID=2024614 RepID=UPI0011F0BD61|nr:H-NS histone family protein [Tardiphaga sp. P9-11]KAA0072959.1 H-NS histone family protein [Tardiphaga sp. P9-11]
MSKPDLPDLDAMQFDELWTIHEELTKILSDRILGEKRELEKRLAILNQTDPSGNEGRAGDLRSRPSRRKYPKVLPKYFNPSSPNETWSGRGKKPRWLIVALQKGHVLEELKIKKEDGDSVHELVVDEEPTSR